MTKPPNSSREAEAKCPKLRIGDDTCMATGSQSESTREHLRFTIRLFGRRRRERRKEETTRAVPNVEADSTRTQPQGNDTAPAKPWFRERIAQSERIALRGRVPHELPRGWTPMTKITTTAKPQQVCPVQFCGGRCSLGSRRLEFCAFEIQQLWFCDSAKTCSNSTSASQDAALYKRP